MRMPQLCFAAQERAAAGAAVADQVRPVRAVVAGMDQACLFRAVEDLHPLLGADMAREPALNQKLAGPVEDEAHVLRLVAFAHARPARTIGQGDEMRALDEILHLFVGMHPVFRIDRFLYCHDPHEGRGVPRERGAQRLAMVFFPQFAQSPVFRGSVAFHKGKLKHARNERDQAV